EDLFGRISLSNGTTLGLAELDNNGDGVIDGGDRGVVLQEDGLLIDIAALARFHHADRFDPLGPSTLLLDGIQELTVDDFMRRPTEGADEIVATSAADTLRLGGGDDVARGAEGDDVLMGEAGNDRLLGEAGNDVLAGGAGDDLLSGGSGANRLMGGEGSDFLEGSGQPGASGDFMAGGAGNDRIQGGRGNDVIQGGDGDDALAGRRGSNQVWGGAGDDLIEIGMDDRIHAGIGDDVVQVASRRDHEYVRRSEITLGSGQDRFEMTGKADERYGRGFHTLLDFRPGEDLLGELGFGEGRTIGFAELDGNGDGVVDQRDQGVGFSQGGLMINLHQVAEQTHGAFTMNGPSALRLVGVDALRPEDFVQG
ncbi:MAG TPA: calcium-binding protein, partial [Geminicoccus sp.]|uniref:calcium-binding protein n=1 Tax=Geminicoccus sp. TaxID=2024832 RepID=UPI002C7311B5